MVTRWLSLIALGALVVVVGTRVNSRLQTVPDATPDALGPPEVQGMAATADAAKRGPARAGPGASPEEARVSMPKDCLIDHDPAACRALLALQPGEATGEAKAAVAQGLCTWGADAEACLLSARAAYEDGDWERAFETATSACERGGAEAGCELREKVLARFPDLQSRGGDWSGDEIPERQAIRAEECRGGNARACALAAGLSALAGDREAALELDQTACERGLISSCANLVRRMNDGPETLEMRLRYAEFACEKLRAEGCLALAKLQMDAGHEEGARAARERACMLGVSVFCDGATLTF